MIRCGQWIMILLTTKASLYVEVALLQLPKTLVSLQSFVFVLLILCVLLSLKLDLDLSFIKCRY